MKIPQTNGKEVTEMSRITLLLTVVLCLLLGCFVSCTGAVASAVPPETAETDNDGRVEITYAVSEGGTIEGWRSQHGAPGEATAHEVTVKAKTGYVFDRWSDGSTALTRQDVFGTEDCTYTAYFRKDRAELPILSIQTATGGDVTSKTDYLSCTVSLCNTGNVDDELSAAAAGIRGRGNATWTFEKKSYRIRFDEKRQLLGLGTGKSHTWILMANQCDQSMLRNYLSIYMANLLDGIGFNSSGTFVEVYLNGDYHGVYLLAEQVQDTEYRVDIGRGTLTDLTAEDIGFFVELDNYAEGDYAFWAGDKPYEVKSEVYTEEQFAYIRQYIRDTDDAVCGGDRAEIEKYLDISSAVDGYILEEYFKNIDVGWSSFYMWKRAGEDEVLHLGPFWDFDLAAGNDLRLDDASPMGIYVGADYGFSQGSRWFIALCECDWFMRLVRERWQELSPVLDAVEAELDRVSASAPTAFNRNYDRWPIFGQRINQELEAVMALDTYDEHVAYLRDWLSRRRGYLTRVW